MAIPNAKLAPLPEPPPEYNVRYMEALVGALESYASRLDGGNLLMSEVDARRYTLLVGEQ